MSQSSPRADQTRVCGLPSPREEYLESAGFDPQERQVLDLMRLILAGIAGGRPRHGAEPLQVAQALFGPGRGDVLLAALTAVVQVMAMSRSDRFHYANPYCRGCAAVVTRDEGHLIRVLHHLRRGGQGRAMLHALMLREARPVQALIDSAADLASLLPWPPAQETAPAGGQGAA